MWPLKARLWRPSLPLLHSSTKGSSWFWNGMITSESTALLMKENDLLNSKFLVQIFFFFKHTYTVLSDLPGNLWLCFKKLCGRVTGQKTIFKMALWIEYGSAVMSQWRHWSVKIDALTVRRGYVGGFRKLGIALTIYQLLSSPGSSSPFPLVLGGSFCSTFRFWKRKLSFCATTLYYRPCN